MEEKNEKKTGRGGGMVAALVLLPVFYVLSIGPVNRVMVGNPAMYCRHTSTLVKFYAPVTWVAQKTPLSAPLEAYVNWWIRL